MLRQVPAIILIAASISVQLRSASSARQSCADLPADSGNLILIGNTGACLNAAGLLYEKGRRGVLVINENCGLHIR